MGNLFALTPGNSTKYILSGSHLDSVRKGGNFDGVIGVVGALETVSQIRKRMDAGELFSKGVGLVVWRGEESASYSAAYKGSLAAAGLMSVDLLDREDKGFSLEDAINSQKNPLTGENFNTNQLRLGQSTLSQQFIDSIDAYVEMHTAQYLMNHDVGIANSIRGAERLQIEFMSDIIVDFLVNLDKFAVERIAKGVDLVQTAGVINIGGSPEESPLQYCSLNTISGYAEIRMEHPNANMRYMIDAMQKVHNVTIRVGGDPEWESIFYILGKPGHSGATPMGSRYRNDANLAGLYLINHTKKRYPWIKSEFNYPIDFIDRCQVDIRSNNTEQLSQYLQIVLAARNGAEVKHLSSTSPVEYMDQRLQDLAFNQSVKLGYETAYVPSGAGHDIVSVMKMNKSDGSTIPGLLILAKCNGQSHCPEENIESQNIVNAANVQANSIYTLAKSRII